MKRYEPLTKDELESIATIYIKESGSTPSIKEPVSILVAGQSGAGKSSASSAVKDLFSARGGHVLVDADRLREELNIGNLKISSQKTQEDAAKLTHIVRAKAVEQKRNIIEEGTFRIARNANMLVDHLKDNGYSVEMIAVATPKAESALSIHNRYEYQIKAQALNPRLVPTEYHENSFNGFRDTVKDVENKLDRIQVINREGDTLYDSKGLQDLSKERKKTAMEALTKGQEVTPARHAQIVKEFSVLKNMALNRNASPEYLKELDTKKESVTLKSPPKSLTNKESITKTSLAKVDSTEIER